MAQGVVIGSWVTCWWLMWAAGDVSPGGVVC